MERENQKRGKKKKKREEKDRENEGEPREKTKTEKKGEEIQEKKWEKAENGTKREYRIKDGETTGGPGARDEGEKKSTNEKRTSRMEGVKDPKNRKTVKRESKESKTIGKGKERQKRIARRGNGASK